MASDLLIERPLDQVVLHYAKCAAQAGLDGVVCSPLEAGKVHEACGQEFVTVTPGVRFADGDVGVEVEHVDVQPGEHRHGLFHRVRYVVELQIQKDLVAPGLDLPDNGRA